MEQYRIEYIRKNNRKKGKKKGVLYCGIDPNDKNSVVIGFSICSPIDRFDYIEGQRQPGFGLEIAKIRAEKWNLHNAYFIQNSWDEDLLEDENMPLKYFVNPNSKEIVEIPPSIEKRLEIFISRCKKYYKDKEFPEWINKFESKNAYDDLEVINARDEIFFQLQGD